MTTGVGSLAAPHARAVPQARLADFVELTKPKIVVMELLTILVAMHLASGGGWSVWALLATAAGAGLVAASANAFNHWIERRSDAEMLRTADRPLPGRRLTSNEVLRFGVATGASGVTLLGAAVNWQTAAIAAATWILYVGIYTPLKSRSTLNTAVGAVSGALPILIGWAAGGGEWNLYALGLFAVLYVWQFPHFMAIAWLCREDYQRAGLQMSTTVDPTGRRAGIEAVAGAILLPLVSMLPAAAGTMEWPWIYAAGALAASWPMLATSWEFASMRSDITARRLMRASLVYLPVWLLVLWVLGG